ncbi:hypothetical protein like AT3G05327 [Hibiscus trionum]|uniref:Cyclin n=1 Tax=Hibiscus trionum TaxID=183268 RepID=A0A9W7M3W4_HIBTR|nr:hypothetical protein like AT3G05327 [Hibiscus trionum]
METLMAGGSNPYIGLGLDESGNWIPGTPRVLSLLSSVLERSIRGNEKLLAGLRIKDGITPFHGTKQPSLDVRQYVERIFRYCKCSNSCFVVAIIYIDRFLQRIDAYLTSLNVHRLLITTVLVAAKFMDDQCYNNAYYAKVGGVSTEELNRLEMKLLFDLDFQLHVTTEVFNKYWLKIQQEGDAAGTAQRPKNERVAGNRRGRPL